MNLDGSEVEGVITGGFGKLRTPGVVPDEVPTPGDRDVDGDVDFDDLHLLLTSYNVYAGGALDGDGDADLNDLHILLANYGAWPRGAVIMDADLQNPTCATQFV